jgi:hypothetical protein
LHQGFVGIAHVFLIRRSSVGVVQGSSGPSQLQQHTMIDCCSLQATKKLRVLQKADDTSLSRAIGCNTFTCGSDRQA